MRSLFVAALAALGFLLCLSEQSLAEYDKRKFCQPTADVVIILIDVTTQFDDRARDIFQRGIADIVSGLTPGESVHIATIEDSYSSTKVIYDGCVPYCPSGILDFFTSECTSGLIRLESQRQMADIRNGLRARLAEATADMATSDIVRTIAYAVQGRPASRKLDLFIFSDMIENSEFMAGKMFWAQPAAASIQMIAKNALMPDLSNAEVKVFGVGRGGSGGRHPLTQDRINKLHDFWSAYFTAAGNPNAEISESLLQ